jgi:Cu(I)/Ag(I) efflux system protein CusF
MKAKLVAVALIACAAFVYSGEAIRDGRAATHDYKPQGVHSAVGVVKKLDPKAGTATIAHEPVKELKWPAMTMPFKVQDKAALDKLGEGKKVEFEFEERGKDYVITRVK